MPIQAAVPGRRCVHAELLPDTPWLPQGTSCPTLPPHRTGSLHPHGRTVAEDPSSADRHTC